MTGELTSRRGITRRRLLAAGPAVLATLATFTAACRRASPTAEPTNDAGGDIAVQPPRSDVQRDVPTVALVESPPNASLAGNPFTLGVASGDPDPSSVVLWTRLAPDALSEHSGIAEVDATIAGDLAEDADFRAVVASVLVTARTEDGHAVHHVARDLAPGAQYWYRFRIDRWTSPVGRTRTTPDPDDPAASLLLAAASCQHWEHGTYAAHRHLAAQRPDLVVFLGDFIYEGGQGRDGVRTHNGPEATDLAGYRRRYALYRSDPDLQAAQAAAPWAVVWDDHEVQNNYAGAQPAPGTDNGSDTDGFAARRTAAYRAWWENQPVRLPPPQDGGLVIHRELRWGTLLQLLLLDGRQYRSPQPCEGTVGPICAGRDDGAAQMLGAAQEAWLTERFAAGATEQVTWTVLANQTVMTDMTVAFGNSTFALFDQWDGYPAARKRVLEGARAAGLANLVVLTGDLHCSIVGDLAEVPGDPVVGAEFAVTSVSSRFPPELEGTFELAMALAPAVQFADTAHRGFLAAQVGRDTIEATYHWVDALAATPRPSTLGPSTPLAAETTSRWVVRAGTPGARPA